MSYKNILFTNNSQKIIKNNRSSNKIIESYNSLSERRSRPVISSAIKNDKKIRFGLLSKLKPDLTDIKGIKNANKIKLINSINSFRKIYFDYYKSQDFSMKELLAFKKENNFFSKNYKVMKEKTGENKKQYFADLKEEYEKNNYYVPAFVGNNHNLFKGNLLLNNDNDLHKYILYDYGSKKSNMKSLSFLEKIQNEMINKRKKEEEKPIFVLNKNSLINHKSNIDKIFRDKKKEIKKSKSEINKVKNTIELIDEIDFFFNSDNRQYLDKLKYQDSRESSANPSTRVNSAGGIFENMQFKYYNNIIKNSNIKNKNNIIMKNIDNLNTENTNCTNANNITESTIVPLKIDRKTSIICDFKNNGASTERYENKRNKTIKKNTIKKNSLEGIDDTKKIRLKTRIQTRQSIKISSKNILEKLYMKISKKGNNNTLKFNNQVKNYFNSYKNIFTFEGKKDINPFNISNKVDNVRIQINDSESLKRDIYLRKQSDNSLENINKINDRDLKLKKHFYDIEDKMIKLFCDLNNPNNIKS